MPSLARLVASAAPARPLIALALVTAVGVALTGCDLRYTASAAGGDGPIIDQVPNASADEPTLPEVAPATPADPAPTEPADPSTGSGTVDPDAPTGPAERTDPTACTPTCDGLECGDDGCGGSCGTCATDGTETCAVGQCVVACAPSCDGLSCGDDGCGGSCGSCAAGSEVCLSGSCEPAIADLVFPEPVVTVGQTVPVQWIEATVDLVNVGTGPLYVTGFWLQGHAGFRVYMNDTWWAPGDASQGAELPTPIVVPAGAVATVPVKFQTSEINLAAGTFTVATNDPDGPESVDLRAHSIPTEGRCLTATPLALDLGGVAPGETSSAPLKLVSCGDEPVTIEPLKLLGASPELTLATGGAVFPVTLGPGESVVVQAVYAPTGDAPTAQGSVRVDSDAQTPSLDLPVTGHIATTPCPTAVAAVAQGSEATVEPFQSVTLDATGSYGESGIAKVAWHLAAAPEGSRAQLGAASHQPTPTFTPDLAGTYTFELVAFDGEDQASCSAATLTVEAVPSSDLYVEMLWQPVEGATGPSGPLAAPGPDADLHFAHPSAASLGVPWYVQPWDAFWFNPSPDWGPAGPDGDPSLLREEGAGGWLETLEVAQAADGDGYRVGVHIWSDHGWGGAEVSVRVWVAGTLELKTPWVTLDSHDLWEVASIGWPLGSVVPLAAEGGSPKVFADFVDATFPAP